MGVAGIGDLNVDADGVAGGGAANVAGAVADAVCAGETVFDGGGGAVVPGGVDAGASHGGAVDDEAAVGGDVGVPGGRAVADGGADLDGALHLAVYVDAGRLGGQRRRGWRDGGRGGDCRCCGWRGGVSWGWRR